MEIKSYLLQMKQLQNQILIYVDGQENVETEYEHFKEIFENFKINENKYKIIELLLIIIEIANNHHRSIHFFPRIERIILYFKKSIIQSLSNSQIFNLVFTNSRLLLFFIDEGIVTLDHSTSVKIGTYEETYKYFLPEIISSFKKFQKPNESGYKSFDEKRRLGENDKYICQLIRNDSIEEFVSYVNKINLPISTFSIDPSCYETNFLISNELDITLIEYAAFFGSMQILQYLFLNGVELKPKLWTFAIHSNNAELIHFLEEHMEGNMKDSYIKMFTEAVSCHHNEIANYFKMNYFDEEIKDEVLESVLFAHNYEFLPEELSKPSILFQLCLSKYYYIVDFLLKTMNFDINEIIILHKNLNDICKRVCLMKFFFLNLMKQHS